MIHYLHALLTRHGGQNLTQRFARATALLATVVLLLTVLASWWLAQTQNETTERVLRQKEVNYTATLIGTTIRGVSSRMAEMADGSLLSAAITDSAGRESYLHPYISTIHHVNGIPVSILFTDFLGRELSSNSYASFTQQDRIWLARQLEAGTEQVVIQEGESGPELLAIELIKPPRTGQPEGALAYKFSLDSVFQADFMALSWKGKSGDEFIGKDKRISAPVELPLAYSYLNFRVVTDKPVSSVPVDNKQLALILTLALIMAASVLMLGRQLALALTRQLRQLEAFSSEVVRDGFGIARADVQGSDEVSNLAISVNHMLDTLHSQHALLQQESERRNQLLARYRLLIEGTNAISWEAQLPDFNYIFVSPQAVRLFGYTIDEWQVAGFWERHVHPDDLEAVKLDREIASDSSEDYRCEYRLRHQNGDYMWIEEIGSVVFSEDNVSLAFRGILLDVGQRKSAESEIQQLAFYDSLTGLPNRRLLLDRLREMVEAGAGSETHGAILFIDLDNFKTLNDTLGHDMGDLLLQQVAQRLQAAVRKNDIVARLGGDEFVVMLQSGVEAIEDITASAKIVANKILQTLDKPYFLRSHEHHSSASIGVYLFDPTQDTVTEMLQRADLAMYHAKAAGRNDICFFDPGMQSVLTRRSGMEVDLRRALRKNEFVLYYQPQIKDDNSLRSFEVLVRWQHPERGLVPPVEFIGLAEETGLIVPIGLWVLEQTCMKLVEWSADPFTAELTLSANVSVRQFRHEHFVEQVLGILEKTGADPRKLKLELTESLLVEDMESTIHKIKQLKASGICFSLDDFGTGYSSLSYLRRLPLDEIKIDQSFFRNILHDETDAAIVRTIVVLAQSLQLELIAEGVENELQREFLIEHGCYVFQGFLYGHPMDEQQLGVYLTEKLADKNRASFITIN